MRVTFLAPLLALAIIAPRAAEAQDATPFQQFLTDIVEVCVNAPEAVTSTLQSHGFQAGNRAPRSEHRIHNATFEQRQVTMSPPMQVRRVWQLCSITITPQLTRAEAAAIIDPILTPIPVREGSYIMSTYGGAWCLNSMHSIGYSFMRHQTGRLDIRPNRAC